MKEKKTFELPFLFEKMGQIPLYTQTNDTLPIDYKIEVIEVYDIFSFSPENRLDNVSKNNKGEG